MPAYPQVPIFHFLTLRGKEFYKSWASWRPSEHSSTTVSKRFQFKLNSIQQRSGLLWHPNMKDAKRPRNKQLAPRNESLGQG